MPHFAPNKYVIAKDKLGKDYHQFSNVPDMERVIEVSETQAEQVMRKQSQWIEVKPQEVKIEKEIRSSSSGISVADDGCGCRLRPGCEH